MAVEFSPREQSVVAYAILAILVLGTSFLTLRAPLDHRLAFSARLDNQRMIYGKSVSAIEKSETLQHAFQDRESESDLSKQLLHADTAALAGAALQSQVTSLITADHGTLVSAAFRPSSESLPLTPITVAVRVRCSIDGLLKILYSLGQSEPALFVDTLSIQSRYQLGRPTREPAEELDVEFEVTGYLDGS